MPVSFFWSLFRELTVSALLALALVAGLAGAGISKPAFGQAQVPGQQPPVQQRQLPTIQQINVVGTERIEPATIASYLTVRAGDPFNPEKLDQSLKNLVATGLFSDVELIENNGALVVRVVENPIINRVIFEGNDRLDRDELMEEVRLRPRMVFTRAKVRADVSRMLNLYRTSGRFAAIIEPKVVQQAQNRVDVVFEIQEGPETKVSKINFIGNKKYSDGDLRDVLATKESRWWKFFTSNDTFDPDRLAYDQQVLRQFYLNEGYADFRVISAVSELTPDREDFFITFTVEEGEIYEFGKLEVESEIRDVEGKAFRNFLRMREGMTYNAEAIEQTVESLTNAAGLLGYAFVDVRPQIRRERDSRKINITFLIENAPRVYVERINIAGNVRTLDRVIRREFRLQEGDAFNSALVRRSENRLNRLNFFREVEIEQSRGSAPDRMVIDVKVEEQSTGQLNIGAGFSSLENFIFDFNISQENLLGKGQSLRLGLRLSGTTQQIDLGFTEPYFMGRAVSAGFNIFANRTDATRFGGNFSIIQEQEALGASIRLGFALTEFWSLSTRYTVRSDRTDANESLLLNTFNNFLNNIRPGEDATEEERQEALERFDLNGDGEINEFDFDTNNNGVLDTSELAVGSGFSALTFQNTLQSIVGYTIGFDTRNSIIRPTRGKSFFFSQDIAGVGGDVRYVRSRVNYDSYYSPFSGWTFRLGGEAGFIDGLDQEVRVTDRFFIGGPRMRGFDNAGIGPGTFTVGQEQSSPQGGRAFYIGRAELFFPLGEGALEMGINSSVFIDVGSLWKANDDFLAECQFTQAEHQDFLDAVNANDPDVEIPTLAGPQTCLAGNTPSPRAAVGIGFSWQSPFGPFRIDLTKPLASKLGDETQTLQFNVGTAF
ncbi:outer membrane protein assembly factor BamA [Yunchengibacter salinarum]|uniref:outer membrane protein assembly factor BamA n=1 Tax=Yunchengibacter salinarum TaxID=3133399 RepID=UPI0035B6813F